MIKYIKEREGIMETVIKKCEEKMNSTIKSIENKFTTVRAGRANPAMLDGINVEYYGVETPIKQLANISIPEARQLMIKPFDKGILKDIEKAIQLSDINLPTQNDGTVIRLVFPPLTEQTRKQLVKDLKTNSENSKIAIRNIRRDVMDQLKKYQKEGLMSEDELKRYEEETQKATDSYIVKVDDVIKEKEKAIMQF